MSSISDQIAGLSPAELALLEARLRDLRASAPREESIPPAANRETVPLSSAQQRMWFLEQLNPGLPTYNRLMVYRLKGSPNVKALDDSLTEIVRRHEILRTAFSTVKGQPLQIIFPVKPFVSQFCDLSDVAPESKEDLWQRLASEEGCEPFDLEAGLLVRAKVLRFSQVDHLLVLTFHHIAVDGWSISIFMEELRCCYEAFSSGRAPALAPLPLQYVDYAVWQREQLQGPLLEQQLQYWREQLAEAPQELGLPTDHPRPAVQSYRGATAHFELAAELVRELKEWSREQGVTLFMSLLAVFQLLLWRYSGERELVVGTPIANRGRVELEGLIGCFANTLVLRTRVEERESYRELVRRVREVCLGAYAHQEVPFERLVEELQPERKLSNAPLFQVMFALQNVPAQPFEFSELKFEPVIIDNGSAKFDLALIVEENQESLSCCFEYSTDLFEAATIARMIGHLKNLLQGVLNSPDQRLWQIPILTQEEQQQVLVEWNQTHTDYPRQPCIQELFEEQVERTPHVMALASEEESLTYRELNERANQVAGYLRELGVGPEVLVGLMLERSVEMVVGLLGVLKAGGAYVPLDVLYPRERISYMLEDTGAPVLLTQQRLLDQLPEHEARTVCIDSQWGEIARHSRENPEVKGTAANLAYVIYTSGSTGKPKGICLSHKGINRLVLNTNYLQLDASDRIGQVSNSSFDAAVFEIWGAFLNGARLEIIRKEVALEPGALRRQFRSRGITTVMLPVALFNQVVAEDADAFVGMKHVFFGAEEADPKWVRTVVNAGKPEQLGNVYGPTENTTLTTWHEVREVEEGATTVPIGKPVSNTDVYILNEAMSPVPVGVRGELYTGGDGLARGYLGRPGLTAEKFVPHPFSREGGARLYKTGDVCRYRADGSIEFQGRQDHQVKLRGFRIELGEIQEVLTQHPSVRAAVVVMLGKERSKRIVAYVVGEQPQATDTDAIRNYLRQRLPDYMVPSAFVTLENFPLTPNGKMDVAALPAPEVSEREMAGHSLEAPGGIEEILASIWADVLSREKVGLFDEFFNLGGHSLLATQVLSRIREAFGIELPLSALFDKATVAKLAKKIAVALRGDKSAEDSSIQPTNQKGPHPLSFAQQRIWFMERLKPGSGLYNVPIAYRIQGELNLDALEQSINTIIKRHDTLRTKFQHVDGELKQIVEDGVECKAEVVELEELSEADRESEMQRLASEGGHEPFDLEAGLLVRAKVLRFSQVDHLLVLTFHHIAVDGWSISIFMEELRCCYEAFSSGRTPALAPLPLQYVDYAVWQREQLQGPLLEEQLQYWREQLAEAPQELGLPTDHPRPAVQSHRGATAHFELAAELVRELKEWSREQGVTLFMSLLAVFQLLLWRYSGERELVVGTPIANRGRVELEGLIGCFANTLVLRTRVEERESYRELVRRVREVCLGAYAHQEVPFERLVEELQPERKLSHTPLCQVVFSTEYGLRKELVVGKTKWTPVIVDTNTSKFDLFLQFHEEQDCLKGRLVYNTDLFESDTMHYMLRHLENLLESALTRPDTPVSELEMLLDEERRLLGGNSTDDLKGSFAGESDLVDFCFE